MERLHFAKEQVCKSCHIFTFSVKFSIKKFDAIKTNEFC